MKALIEEYGLGVITAIVFVILSLLYKQFGTQLNDKPIELSYDIEEVFRNVDN